MPVARNSDLEHVPVDLIDDPARIGCAAFSTITLAGPGLGIAAVAGGVLLLIAAVRKDT